MIESIVSGGKYFVWGEYDQLEPIGENASILSYTSSAVFRLYIKDESLLESLVADDHRTTR